LPFTTSGQEIVRVYSFNPEPTRHPATEGRTRLIRNDASVLSEIESLDTQHKPTPPLLYTDQSCYYYRPKMLVLITLHASCGTVYYNWSCLFVCVCGSVITITRNCVHRSSPNWVCR